MIKLISDIDQEEAEEDVISREPTFQAPKEVSIPLYQRLFYSKLYNSVKWSSLLDNNLLLNIVTFGTYSKLVRACCNEIDMHSKVLQLGGTFGNQLAELADSVGYYGHLDVMDVNGTQLSRLEGKYETPYPQMHFIRANAEDGIEGEYDAYTMPYMINGGKYSYFTKICTEMVTKIINVPILKNAGTTITGCMKNLAFGSITNTARLHGQMWNDTCASVCAFPPLRDKVVLNILDGMIGCFDGGPAANPQFICPYHSILAGTDPVAVDEVGYRMILEKRLAEGVQKEEKKGARAFLEMAETLGLGIANPEKIDLHEINLNG